MTNPLLITPPLELVEQWRSQAPAQFGLPRETFLATQAARWGADQQLAKDAKWLDQHALDAPHLKITPAGESLIEAMRPTPPSLKEQALAALESLHGDSTGLAVGVIRLALITLDDD